MSCGCDPPSGKYRWPNRTCAACRTSLDSAGYVTLAGRQVQENLQVPTCYPGVVRVCGEQFPPDPKKWDQVQVPKGRVKCDLELARLSSPGMERPKKFVDVEKDDLAKLSGIPPPRFTHALAGIGLSGARPMVSANTSYNRGKALMGRVFRKLEAAPWGRGPAPGIWKWTEQFIPLLLPHFRAKKMSFEDWLATMPSRRRKALMMAYIKYHRTGWKDSYEKFTAFVKSELLPGFAKRGGDLDRLVSMTDRLIQGPHDVTHCIAGPWLKPLVKALKENWTSEEQIFYGSNSPEELHRWLQHLIGGESLYFWSDFTMFDNTHSQDSWAFMRRLYRDAGIDDPEFWRVLDVWERPKGTIGAFKYQGPIMNASGRDDTALANGVLNGFATLLSATAALLGKSLCTLTVHDVMSVRNSIRLSVCGDDSLGSVPLLGAVEAKAFQDRMRDNLRMFGFSAKLFSSDRLSDAVYLGMRPYPSKSGWFWGKTIGRATYKMGWVTLKGSRDIMAHITGIADMHTLCSSHVPVLADLAHKICELRQGAKRTPVLLDPNRPWEWTFKSGVAYDDITLKAVAEAYSVRPTALGPHEVDQEVTVQDVKELVDTIQGISRLPCVLDHWLWRRMVLVDDL